MADRIKGITIEIGGDTTGLNKALQGVNSEIRNTQSQLKDVERLLKLDPTNTELLKQKQKLLAEAVGETKSKLDTLKEANRQAAESASNYDAWKEKYDPIKRKIDETKKKLADLKTQSEEADKQLASGEISQEKYDALQAEIKDTSKELRTLQKSARDVTDEFGNPISPEQYDALQREIIETGKQLKNLEDQAQKTNSAVSKIGQAGESLKEFGSKVTSAGTAMMPATAVITGAGVAATKSADDMKSAVNTYLSATGNYREGTEEAVQAAEQFEEIFSEIYKNNYGESLDDIARSAATVKTNMQDIPTEGLQKATESAITLRDVFGYEVTESTRAANTLMKQFGISSDEAFNLIAQGAQNGLDYSGELLDSINEYSVQFEKVGLDADDMFNIFSSGAKNGAFNLDKIGDAVKELSVRVVDGSDATVEGFEAAGLSAEDMAKEFGKGGESAKKAFKQTINGLKSIEDPLERNTAGVNLFGTMWEDLGEDVVLSMADAEKSIDATADAMGQLQAQKYDDLKNEFASIGRTITADVAIPLGQELIPMIKEVVQALKELVSGFAELSPEAQKKIISVGLVAAALGPLLIGIGQLSTGISSIMTLVSTVGPAIGALGAAGGPVLITVGALGLLIAAMSNSKDETDLYAESLGELTPEQQANKEMVDNLYESYRNLDSQRQGAIDNIQNQANMEQLLWQELQSIVDENGKVSKGYEDRASVITGQLSEALGIEMELTGDQIQNYKDLSASIDDIIQKKQANALLAANEAAYTEALTKQTDAYMSYNEAKKAVEDTTQQMIKAQEEEAKATQEIERLWRENIATGVDVTAASAEWAQKQQESAAVARELSEKLSGLNQTYEEAENAYIGYNTVIENYEGLAAAIVSGDQEEISKAVLQTVNSFQTVEAGTRESLTRQVADFQGKYQEMKDAVDAGAPGITAAQVENMAKLVTMSQAELDKLSAVTGKSVSDAADTVKKNAPEMESAWSDVTKGASKGIEGGTKDVNKSVDKLVDSSVDEFKKGYEIDSSSKVTQEIGGHIPEGLQTGIEDETDGVLGAVGDTATQTMETLKTNLPKEQFVTMGKQIPAGLSEGVTSGKSEVLTSVQQMCDETVSTAKNSLGIHSPSTEFAYVGQMSGEGFVEGWNGIVPEILNAISGSVGQAVIEMKETFNGIDTALLTLRDSSGSVIASVVENAQEAQEALQGIQSGLEDTVSNQVDIFSEFGGQAELSTEELLSNMQSQVEGTEQWAENLRILAERGVDQGLLQKMAEMGPKGAGYVTTFSQMTDEELQRANALFAQSMTLPGSTAESIMQSYKVAGQMTAQGFSGGITENAELAVNSAGQVANEAMAMLRETLEINSPSRATAEIGQYFSEGFAAGIAEGADRVANAVNNVVADATGTLKNNLNLSQGDFTTFQTSTSSGWTTWAAGLAETLRTTLGQINTDTSSNLLKMQTTVTTYLSNIKKEWGKQLGEIRKKHDESMDAVDLKTTEAMTAMAETIQTQTEQMALDAKTAMNELVADVGEELDELEPTIKGGFEPGVKYITSLIDEARTWGNHMMQELIQGLEDYLDELEDVCEDIADTISDNLHFTRPERGSLRNYEEWMPHFMQGLAKGIADNKYLVSEQIQQLADDMAILKDTESVKQTINFTNRSILIVDGEKLAETVDTYLGGAYG